MSSSEFLAIQPASSARSQALRTGASVYGTALEAAGGREVETLAHQSREPAFHVALYDSKPYNLRVPGMPAARLALTLTRSRVIGGLQDDAPRQFDTSRHALFLTPSQAEARWRKDSPSRHLGIYFDPVCALKNLDEASSHCLRTPVQNATLPGLQHIAEGLERELCDGDPFSAEAIDSLVRLLLVRLVRLRFPNSGKARAITAKSVSRVSDYVAANLAGRILCTDLARIVGLGPDHFAQAFRAFTGTPPHRFVLHVRLQKAVDLLRNSPLSLAEVAVECGFSSQQHMTSSMQRNLATTPGRCRAGKA